MVRWLVEPGKNGARHTSARQIDRALTEMEKRGVQLRRDGDRLEVVARLDVLTDKVVKYVGENRDALLAALPTEAEIAAADLAARVAVLCGGGLSLEDAQRQAAEELV